MENRKERDINTITDLTLGLVDTLSSISGVSDITVGMRQGADKLTISSWEQRHGVALPLNLKQLYMMADGFSLTWNYTIANKTLPLGNLEFHPISRLNRIGCGRSSGDVLSPTLADLSLAENTSSPSNGQEVTTVENPHDDLTGNKTKSKSITVPTFHVSKLFEIDGCKGNGKVVIAYPGRFEVFPEGSIWYIDLSLRLHLLTVDIVLYWRMLLTHLGLPQWQALVAGVGVTPWAKQWYEILAPHILDGGGRQTRSFQPELVNKVDWSVFKTKRGQKAVKVNKEKEVTKDASKSVKDADQNKNKDVKDKVKSNRSTAKDVGKT